MASISIRSIASCTRSLSVLSKSGGLAASTPPRRILPAVVTLTPAQPPCTAAASAAMTTALVRPFSTSPSYYAKKKEAKERRRELFEQRVERKERVKHRRNGKPRDVLRREFRAFWIKKKVDEEYMDRKARQAGLDWKIDVAVILERQNIVVPDKEPWEVEMEDLQTHLARYGKMYPKGLFNVDYESDNIAMTDKELLDLLPEGFTPAPRETVADETGDVRTTERKLKTSVYLTVQDKQDKWMLPTVTLQEDENFVEAAKRALADQIGPEVEFWCPSNCPCAVDMVALPMEERSNSGLYGTKTFFMKVVHDEGQVSEKSMKIKDYAWLDRGEITEKMKQEHGDYVAKFYHYVM